jgi:hypothetical protein
MKKTYYFILLLVTVMGCSGATVSQQPPKQQLSEDELLTLVQQQTFRYFWDYGHPVSGLARERSNSKRLPNGDVVTFGGSGFGVMAIIVGIERGFITREQGIERMGKILAFLDRQAEHFHGIWPHWMNGSTGETVPFSRKDDGADLVETAFMFEGLLAAHQYFSRQTPGEKRIRNVINKLWREAEWNFFTQDGQDVLYWHWSPRHGWAMNHAIRGHNECQIVYILAAASPTYPIEESVYHEGWATGKVFQNGEEYYGIRLPLGPAFGGPLFFAHYSHMGLDPRGLRDRYADYWEQMVNHTLINRQHCIENPNRYKGYGAQCWGLTASDGNTGYSAHSPKNDRGVITPTAALSSMPYTPEYSMDALRYFYYELGNQLWGEYGFKDAFNLSEDWFAPSYLAIDQGPIIVMIENYRTGLLWNLFMSHPDVQNGLKKLGFTSPHIP